MNIAVCTLCEGDYVLGAAALINSLHRFGFAGEVLVGMREVSPLAQSVFGLGSGGISRLPNGLSVRVEKVETNWHLANYKAAFMLSILNCTPSHDAVAYFDPDIVIRADWRFFDRWIGMGVGLCEDIVCCGMPVDHPIRRQWVAWAAARKIPVTRNPDRYYNAGYIAVPRSEASFLETWHKLMTLVGDDGVDLAAFMPGGRENAFYGVEQDALNLAVMVTDAPLSTLGPEGMDFVGGGFTMSHAAGSRKPWRKNFIRSAFAGIPPSLADKGFWLNVDGPLRPFSSAFLARKRLALRFAAGVGRLIRRA